MSAQKIRVWFRKGERLRFISHLDVLRSWERAIRRAGLPLAYSQGFTPHPKISFASPLPLGFTSEAEVMDVVLEERVDLASFRGRLAAQVPEDLPITGVAEVALSAGPLQASMLWADYRVELRDVEPAEARRAVSAFLAADSFPWTEQRHEKTRSYDLRSGVASLVLCPAEPHVCLQMRLQADQSFTGRPEQVVAALFPGAVPEGYARTGIVIQQSSPAREAWRRKGQYQ